MSECGERGVVSPTFWVYLGKRGRPCFIDEVVRFNPLLIKELWEFDVKMDLHFGINPDRPSIGPGLGRHYWDRIFP